MPSWKNAVAVDDGAVAVDDVGVAAHGTERRVPVSVVAGSFVTPRADVEVRLGVPLVARRSAEVAASAGCHLDVGAEVEVLWPDAWRRRARRAVSTVTDRSIAIDPRAYQSRDHRTADGSTLSSADAGRRAPGCRRRPRSRHRARRRSRRRARRVEVSEQREVARLRAAEVDVLIDEVGAGSQP